MERTATDHTVKIRHIDKDPAKGLLGIRLTNARKIFEDCITVQIFSRNEVTLGFKGLTNDDHTSLTYEDGASFLEWLKKAHPEILTEELWALLPEGPQPGAAAADPITSKAKVVTHLATTIPEVFGQYRANADAGEFYADLFAYLTQPHWAKASPAVYAIRVLETMAHAEYREANACLRQAHLQGEARDGTARRAALVCAVASNYAALLMRKQADTLYNGLDMETKLQVERDRFPEELPTDEMERHEIELRSANYTITPTAEPGLNVLKVHLNGVVTVMNPNSPHFRQIGRVVEINAPGGLDHPRAMASVEIGGLRFGELVANLKPLE